MKTNIIKALLGLILTLSISGLYAQSPRIKLNQITKDTVKGSVLISSPSDSGMVYSRDFYVAYGADTVLILYGDTLAATSGIISSVLSDGVTITGDGTTGNELKVDTSLIATIKALNDSLATISASTTPDGVTITGDGSVGNPLKVDTATVISTIKGLVDTLSARGYLTANQTITLSGDVTGSGTTAITATVVDDSHNHIISNVDFLQDSLTAKANDSDLANYVTIAGTDTITGAKTFTNTFTQSGGDANFDSGTLFVDESANRVGIGTSSPSTKLEVNESVNSSNQIKIVNINTGTSARAGISFINGTGAGDNFGLFLNGDNFNGVSGWDDRFTVQSGSGVANGLLFYSSLGGIQLSANSFNTKDIYVEDGTGNVFMENLGSTLVGDYDLRIETSTGEIGYNTSSVRFKENINDYNKGLEYVLNLRPVTFNYIADTLDKQMVGFIAEQLDEIGLQEGVVYKEDGSVEGINSRIYNPILVNAIKEQQAIIESQQQEIEQLKTQIQLILQEIQILKNN